MKLQTKAINLKSNLTPSESGVDVLLSLVRPNGVITQKHVLTDPTGTAVAQFALNRTRDKPGSYLGRVSLTAGSNNLTDQVSIDVR